MRTWPVEPLKVLPVDPVKLQACAERLARAWLHELEAHRAERIPSGWPLYPHMQQIQNLLVLAGIIEEPAPTPIGMRGNR